MFGFAAELGFSRDYAVTRREDTVHFGGASDRDFCRGFSRDFEQRISLFLQEDFGGVRGGVSAIFI